MTQHLHAASDKLVHDCHFCISTDSGVVKLEVKRDQKFLNDLFSLLILGLDSHLPESIHTEKLLEVDHLDLGSASHHVLFSNIDQTEVLLEAIDKRDGHL